MTTLESPAAAAFRPAKRTAAVTSSAVREILKFTQMPDVISLAGGLPAPDSFPVQELREAFDHVLATQGSRALQYSLTEGEPGLRAWIADRETRAGVPTRPEEVMVVASSQQGLDLIGKVMVEPESPTIVESPTYLGALQAFSVFGPTYRLLRTDDGGAVPEALDEVGPGASFLYLTPNFQNPTGRLLSAERRQAIAEAARRHDFWIVEDDPYGELWYDEAPPASIRSWAPERTLRLCSFSKVLAPGLRLGYITGPVEAISMLVRLKQATDLQTGTLIQLAAQRVFEGGLLERHLPAVRARYEAAAAVILDAMTHSMPRGVTWNRPLGGMFVWATLPDGMDATAVLKHAVERRVAFVPGTAFYAAEPVRETMRLSFVTVPEHKLREGVHILGEVIAAG
ncbi:MAG: PLP-dependent aminotransferase family protein [Chloroflexota bacterium]